MQLLPKKLDKTYLKGEEAIIGYFENVLGFVEYQDLPLADGIRTWKYSCPYDNSLALRLVMQEDKYIGFAVIPITAVQGWSSSCRIQIFDINGLCCYYECFAKLYNYEARRWYKLINTKNTWRKKNANQTA